jgi:hypothetical protein
MPEIFREQGFKVVIYFDDHDPAHVHIYKGDSEIRIQIKGLCEILSVKGSISSKEQKKAMKLVTAHQSELFQIWEEIHE